VLFLTDFADMALLSPLALCVAAWLALSGWGSGARLWLIAFTAVLLVMLALKLAILGCKPSDTIITSPSGHTAAATFVYGGMIVLITRSRIAASLAIGAALAVLFGLSRIMVHARCPHRRRRWHHRARLLRPSCCTYTRFPAAGVVVAGLCPARPSAAWCQAQPRTSYPRRLPLAWADSLFLLNQVGLT
jgi:hypothetical protein